MSMHELAEKIEHAHHGHGDAHGGGHGGGHKPGPSKGIGITMALLGVLLAFSAAMVGAQRTELIKAMVQQSTKWGLYQAETMKFRVMEGDLEMLKALTPKAAEVAKVDETLRSKRRPGGGADDEDTAEIKDLIASSTDDMAELLTPDPGEIKRFKATAREYELDMHEAKEDAEAYDLAIEAHQEAAEQYEHAQLAAEIGIVVASIALLLSSRMVWMFSLVLGAICGGSIGFTYVRTGHAMELAEKRVEEAEKNVLKLEHDDDEEDVDDDATSVASGAAGQPSAPGEPSEPKKTEKEE
ncbi:MAG TPA: DUF4337 family protein [Polyangiaceae bacterium]|jgi:hypothetical protein|nr:DUF4337 family protein [Polyangiaceae bacterium]